MDSVRAALAQLRKLDELLRLQNREERRATVRTERVEHQEQWEAGDLSYKVLPFQRAIYDDIKRKLWGGGGYVAPAGPQRKYVLEIHRKFGKSTLCGIIANELSLQVENARIYWGAETQKQVGRFLLPIMNEYVINDAPERLRPKWYPGDGLYDYPSTGAQIIIGGTEDEAKCNRLRGPGCHLFIIDEAGQIDLLRYLYRSVVLWMTTRTGGRVLIPSSPATSPGHAFTEFCIAAEAGDGGYAHRDVYASDLPAELIEELARECGGKDTPDWQREGLALRVVDAGRAIIGDFSEGKPNCDHCGVGLPNHLTYRCKDADTVYESSSTEYAITLPFCTRCEFHYDQHPGEKCADGEPFEWAVQRPEYFDVYTAMDVGWNPSLTAIGAGYWHFPEAMLVLEGEAELSQPTTAEIAAAFKLLETALWAEYFARQVAEQREDEACRVYRRISDVAPQLLWDLKKEHGIDVHATRKDDKDAQINAVRLLCKRRKLRIHPRCKHLIAHLKAGIWNKKRTDYEWIEGFGHFDFVDMLVYLVRNVNRQHNPEPEQLPPDKWNTTGWRRAQQAPAVPEGYEDLAKLWSQLKPPGRR